MLRNVLLSTAALALLATAANARPQVTLSNDNRFVSVMPGNGSHNIFAPKAKYLWTTLDKSKVGTYFCCYGSTLSGPSSFFGAAYGVAEQFMLGAAASVTKLSAAVGYVSGDKSVTLTLYSDSGSNSPGTALASGKGTAAVGFGSCCGVTSVKISSTSLKANTPYWVAITTTGANYEAAPFQVYNEVNNDTYVSSTSNGGTSWGAGFSETEYNPAIGVN